MDVVHALPAFVLAVVLISASPGPAVALILRRAALRGFRGAVPTVLGLETGLYVWALLAAAGLSALVAASEVGLIVLRIAGAVVLVVLGLRSWRAVLRDRHASADEEIVARDTGSGGTRTRRTFGEGVLVQLANPKAAVFMVAFYPQFVPDDRPLFATTALLALLQVTLETALYLSLAAGVARAGGWFRRRTVRRRLEAVSGTVLVALGLRVATTSS
jgi:threonine/homoserine/homoserine lactone efflux protein